MKMPVCRCPKPERVVRPSGVIMCLKCGAMVGMTLQPKPVKP